MAKTANTESKERAAVGRERRLALALVAIRDAINDHEPSFGMDENLIKADNEARALLDELGYGDLVGIRRRVDGLNAQLRAAVDAGDGNTIAALGLELARAKAGLPPSKPKGGKVGVADA
jgi:hypothetical protein